MRNMNTIVQIDTYSPPEHVLAAECDSAVALSRFGWMKLVMRCGRIERIDFHDEAPDVAKKTEGTGEASEWLKRLIHEMDDGSAGVSWPLAVKGTPFQQRVWAAIRGIPRGERRTYSELADSLGCPKAVRAVANACASNVLACAIPCHRVVRSDGGLGGYRWGIERKARLLEWESLGR